MNFILHNTSRYPADEVRKLARFAFACVLAKARRQGWDDILLAVPNFVHLKDSTLRWNGHHRRKVAAWWLRGYKVKNCEALKRLDGAAKVYWIDAGVGKPTGFPVDATYRRFKNMPAIEWRDWQECVVGLIAHELTHCKVGSDKQGETFCEYTAIEALEKFRAERQTILAPVEATPPEANATESQETETCMNKKTKKKTKAPARAAEQLKAKRSYKDTLTAAVDLAVNLNKGNNTMPQCVNAVKEFNGRSEHYVKAADFEAALVKRGGMTAGQMAAQVVARYPRATLDKQTPYMAALATKLGIKLPE